MSELFGILQLDRGDPYGFAQVPGLVQAWLQDAGGFAAVGLLAYLLYALSTPTDKSESERLRVPVSTWMLAMGALSLICYAGVLALLLLGRGAAPEPPPPLPGMSVKPEPPVWRTELRPILLMVAGLFAILGIGEPFARDLVKIARRNLSFGTAGVTRFGRTLTGYAGELLTPNRVIALVAAVVVYALLGGLLFALGVPRLINIWTGVLTVAVGVFVCALLLLMLFEAEGPVWAIAKLSFKEAVRSQLLWVFLIVFLPFLFPHQWYSAGKPADELRSTTMLITMFLSLLVLFPALLIASLGIPQDIKNLNIFTVVSKPVERFEIVLGRFVGYVALMSLVMLALTGVSLVLVTNTGISEQAKYETYKARVTQRGKLEFRSLRAEDRTDRQEFTGTNVGREFDYRRYIAGHPASPQRAIWHFADVPSDLERPEGDKVPVEFTFDVFRMTKGEQNKGVSVAFRFVTHNAPQRQPNLQDDRGEWQWVDRATERERLAAIERLRAGVLLDDDLVARLRGGSAAATTEEARSQLRLAERMKGLADKLRANGVEVREDERGRLLAEPVSNPEAARPDTPAWKTASALAEEFGYYELRGKEVFDYAVMGVEVPGGLFRNANQGDPKKGPDDRPLPRVSVYVKCESEGQLLGMAEPDLYVLRSEMPYWYNFLKGMIGLWCRLCIVVGLAVAASTYLSAVLVMLMTATVYVVGLFTEHLDDLAHGRSVGGGPFESMSRLVRAEQPTAPLADTAGSKTVLFADRVVAWLFRRIQNLVPDVESFSWSHFVSEGFNINAEFLAVNLLVTFGYLLPWAVLAYYLMKSREVAA